MTKPPELTVTVAITALNEAENIGRFLRSVAEQREDGFALKKIIVISDGSTDATAEAARSVDLPNLEVYERHERKGKGIRMNEFAALADTDILVVADADTVWAHQDVLGRLVAPFRTDPSLAVVGGAGEPVPGKTFVERAMNVGQAARAALRSDNLFSVNGALMAYRTEFGRSIRIPDTFGTDHYLYFAARAAGKGYRFVPEARVWHRSPATLRDAIRQNLRFSAIPLRMERFFGPDVTRREYAATRSWQARRRKFALLIRHPFRSLTAFAVYRYCGLRAKDTERHLTGRWPMVGTTKGIVSSHA